jgi:hypothetical protein
MNDLTQDDYSGLSDVQMAELLGLSIEGDTATPLVAEQVDAPAPTSDDVPKAAQDDISNDREPVILAKDGIHTIPFQKLADEREARHRAEAELARLKEQMEAVAASQSQQAPSQDSQLADDANDDGDPFGEYDADGLKNGIKTTLRQAIKPFEERIKPLEQAYIQATREAHYATIRASHPDFDSIAQGDQVEAWIAAQPSFSRQSYEQVYASGSSAQVIEMLNAFKSTLPTQSPASSATATPAATPKANIKPTQVVPSSLTDFPGASAAGTDKAEAMLQMSSVDLADKFSSMTQEQRDAVFRRLGI